MGTARLESQFFPRRRLLLLLTKGYVSLRLCPFFRAESFNGTDLEPDFVTVYINDVIVFQSHWTAI